MDNVMLQAVQRLRRAQGRNADTMLICDELERRIVSQQVETGCPECERRKVANRLRVRKHRREATS